MWWLYRFCSVYIRKVPWLFHFFGALGAAIKYFLSPSDIRKIMRNIRLVNGPSFPVWKAFFIGHRVLVNFVHYWVDFIWFGQESEDFLYSRVEIVGEEFLRETLSKNRGVVLATAHLGNWEVAGFWLGRTKYPVSAIAMAHGDKRIDNFFNTLRIKAGLKSVIPIGKVTRCIDVLKRGEILAILGDWDFSEGKSVVEVEFCSESVLFPSGLGVFSERFNSPVIPLFCIMQAPGKYQIRILPPIWPEQQKSSQQIVQQYAKCLENVVKDFYLQWYMFGPIRIVPEQVNLSELCIVIPAYNEEKHIGKLLSKLEKLNCKVIVIDDGSIDQTAAISAKYDFVQVHKLSCNEGKGVAIKEGIALAKSYGYKWILIMDADGQHLPEDIPNFLGSMTRRVGMVCGNRMHDPTDMPLIRRFTNWLMSFIISLYTLDWIPDTQCGYRLIRAEAICPEDLSGDRYEIETDLILRIREKGWDIVSVPITSVYHDSAVSYIRPFRDTVRFISFMASDMLRKVRRKKGC